MVETSNLSLKRAATVMWSISPPACRKQYGQPA